MKILSDEGLHNIYYDIAQYTAVHVYNFRKLSLMVICLSPQIKKKYHVGLVVHHLWRIGNHWLVILESWLCGPTDMTEESIEISVKPHTKKSSWVKEKK